METLKLPGSEIELVRLEPGTFVMGSGNVLFDESPAHEVRIERPFYFGKTPVTQEQWTAVFNSNPAHFQPAPHHPVENVTWENSVGFCTIVAERTGRAVRLPSEAEWEYACRAGTASEFFFSDAGPFSDDAAIPASVRRELAAFGWFDRNSPQTTSPVSMKHPNPWGLHDMIGNVWEWCQDYWHEGYTGAPRHARTLDPPHSRPAGSMPSWRRVEYGRVSLPLLLSQLGLGNRGYESDRFPRLC